MSIFSNSDIGTLLIQAQSSFVALSDFISGNNGQIGLAEVVGTFFIALSLVRAAKMSEQHTQTTIGQVLSPLIIGGMLIAWGRTTQTVSESIGLSGGALGYKASTTLGYSQAVIDAALVMVSAIGAASVFRGLLKWKEAGEGERGGGGGDPVWAGVWHIVGGGIAMNISAFLKMLGF